MELLHEIPHPEGRLQDKEITTDRPGRSFKSASQERHGYTPPQMPHEQLSDQFSKEIATFLDQGRNNHLYERLVLVAEPRFLGYLRQNLNDATKKHVAGSLDKDLVESSLDDLPKQLGNLTRIPYQEELRPYDQTG